MSSQSLSALIVVDMQEDFCPPNGSLAVPEGRDIANVINKLLALPFSVKVASQDWHPKDHISFDSSNEPPNNKAFETKITVQNPDDESQSQQLQLWPVHCVQGTKGAEIIDEINSSRLDLIVKKGQDRRTEMFSAFSDMFSRKGDGIVSHDLATWLREKGVERCFTVGLTGDCCVRDTALDAQKHGFETFVIEDATRSVTKEGFDEARTKFEDAGVKVIQSDDQRLQDLEA